MKEFGQVFAILMMAIALPSCVGHSDIDTLLISEYMTMVDSSRSSNDGSSGIILDISDTVMDEETETIVLHSQEWDEVDRNVDL